MIEKLVNIIINSPPYPHWLERKKDYEAKNYILKSLCGKVLEVGAGNGTMKSELLSKNKKIKKYLATDHSSWNEEFENINQKVKKLKSLAGFWIYKKRAELDNICDAEKLPYRNNFFDYHISFEVLEHIKNPDKYFKEATRVLKKGGKIIVGFPFLYRMHGGEPDHRLDFYRYTNGFFYTIAEKNNLKLKTIYSNTGFGTTFASLTNQWLIQRYYETTIFFKLPILIVLPFIFTFTNLVGLLIDVNPDKRFSTFFYVILEKN